MWKFSFVGHIEIETQTPTSFLWIETATCNFSYSKQLKDASEWLFIAAFGFVLKTSHMTISNTFYDLALQTKINILQFNLSYCMQSSSQSYTCLNT